MEEWRPVTGFDGYFVSNYGKIKTHRFQKKRFGRRSGTEAFIDLNRKPFFLKGLVVRGGYLRICFRKNGKKFYKSIHRMVLNEFVGPPPKGCIVCHVDGNPQNNKIDNLIYGTHKLNTSHRKLHGTDCTGEKHPMAKLDLKDVNKIRKQYIKYDRKFGGRVLSKKYGVSISTICRIAQGRGWGPIA